MCALESQLIGRSFVCCRVGGLMMQATTYLESVEHAGAALVFWPQSHIAIHSFLRANPDCLGPGPEGGPPPQLSAFFDEYCASHTPVEFTAPPGTVLIWQSHTIHSGSANHRARPRLGLFARWHHRRRMEVRNVISLDPWMHWRIGGGDGAKPRL